MLTPDKFTAFEESLLSAAPEVLNKIEAPMPVTRLRQKCKTIVRVTADFVLVLDVLFALGAIEVDFQTGEISRVD